jgi:hypothetical protein
MVVKFDVVHKLICFYVVREKKRVLFLCGAFLFEVYYLLLKKKRICTVYEIDMFFKNKRKKKKRKKDKLIPIRMNKKIFRISFFCIIKK